MQEDSNDYPMPSTDDVIEFLKGVAGKNKIFPDTDIYKNVGLAGDDFHDMIEKFAAMYAVDMTDYRWYFHADEEGLGCIGGLFFKPPYKRVKRIPVTPAMLTDFANKGKWDIRYPDHKIPMSRYDIFINQVLWWVLAILLVIILIKKYLR